MSAQRWDLLIRNARLATMNGDGYGAIEDAALAVTDGRIAWLGPERDLPAGTAAREVIDAGHRWITPGLVDCHTHLVYAGNRANEFEMRLNGATYAEVAQAGGGIVSTVKATRAADEDSLFAQSVRRFDAIAGEGVTTVEIKSGYGLDTATEARMLRVARRLGEARGVSVSTTFLGAHAMPPEYKGRQDAYVDLVCNEMLPAIAAEGLADAVDAFCENIGFTPAQTRRVFESARRHGLPVKLHAEQLSDQGGAQLAAEFGALSCDHLEYVSEEGVAAMAKAGTVAVLLPGAFYFLRETKLPPVEAFRRHCVPIAIATDCNPGSSPVTSLLTTLNMACTLFRLTPAEALAGATRNAAFALGLSDRGRLAAGLRADLALWDIGHPAELAYHLGYNPLFRSVREGRVGSERHAAG